MFLSGSRVGLKQCLLAIALVHSFPLLATEPTTSEQLIAQGNRAMPIKHKPPSYPTIALRQGIEGWVIVSFVVNKDGTTGDIEVINSSIEGYFEKATIKAVSQWTYQPATRNGKPVMQYHKRSRHTFKISNREDGVTETFQLNYKNALTAIREGNLEGAKALIDEMDANKKRLLTEVCYLDILKASYFRKEDKLKTSLVYLDRALVIADEVTPEKMHIKLLRQAVAEHARAKNYRTALQYFDTLEELSEELAEDDPLSKLVSAIKQTVAGDGALVSEGLISACDHCGPRAPRWRHALLRNHFTIDQVSGKLTSLEILCGYNSVLLGYEPDMEWSVKKGWGECDVFVSGDEGTSFRFIELPGNS